MTTTVRNFQAATYQFRDRYFTLPGDFNNGSGVWGTNCSTVAADCNGTGDGKIAEIAGSAYTKEYLLFWQHLALAGLIEGKYNGTKNGTQTSMGTSGLTAGSDVPLMAYNRSSMIVDSNASFTDCYNMSLLFPPITMPSVTCKDSYAFIVSKPTTTGKGITSVYGGGTIKAEDAWNIDVKADDGLPDTGKITASQGYGESAGSCSSAGAYSLASSTQSCVMAFLP